MSKQKLKIGDPVVVLKSTHSDILPKTQGVISRNFQEGYGVDITQEWITHGAVRQKRKEMRTVWFPKGSIEKLKQNEK